VFSATGLVAAFLTAVLWFPWMDRRAPRSGALGRRIAASLRFWPKVRGLRAAALLAVLGVFAFFGLQRLQPDDSLRSLQNSPPALVADEIALGRLLGLPSPAQFFLVEGGDAETILQREESLVDGLRAQREQGNLRDWRAVSDWLPSQQRQQEQRDLLRPIEQAARAQAAELLGEAPPANVALELPLRLEDWLQLPLSEPLRPLWLGDASIVMLQGLGPHSDLEALQRVADTIDGVRWVDRSAQISSLLQHHRRMVGMLLLAGYVAVAIALFLRYRAAAWRALLPTALAALLSLALLGWIGEPLQLFAVLAQLLLLGIGVDYGIFLLEHRDDPASWLAVSLGAASTWLAFGLLGLSATPALRSFGLTLMFGIALVWLLSPLFRAAAAPPSSDTLRHAN
jgi:predicted exporter